MVLAKKLQLKPGTTLAVTGAPPDLDLDLGDDVATTGAQDAGAVLVFVSRRADLDSIGSFLDAARADRLAWIAYPKGGRLDTDLNRDIVWELLSAQGIRPVRQIAIDETWSALRFRPA